MNAALLCFVCDFLDPDIAEAHGVAVVLHLQESFVIVLGVFTNRVWACPAGAAGKLDIVLDLDAIVDDGEFGAAGDFAFFVKERAVKGDVVGLPLARFTAGIHERLGTAVESATLAVRIGDVFIAIEHLDFELSHQKDPAVAAALARALDLERSGEFNVESAGTKFFFTLDVTSAGGGLERAINEFPFRRLTVGSGPVFVGFLGAIEQNFGIGWCFGSGRVIGRRRDNFRLRLFRGIFLVHLDAIDEHVFDFFAILLTDFFGDDRRRGGDRSSGAGDQCERKEIFFLHKG